MKELRSLKKDNSGVSGNQVMWTLILTSMVVGGSLLAYNMAKVEGPAAQYTERTINRGAGDIGVVFTFPWETYGKGVYSTDDIGDYTAGADVKARVDYDGNKAPSWVLVKGNTYDSLVGINSTIDSHGGDVYWQSGHQTESKLTALGNDFIAYDGHNFGAAEDSAKCWFDQKYDTTATNTTAIIMKLRVRSVGPATDRMLWDESITIPIRVKYQPQASSYEYIEGNTHCYFPFAGVVAKEDIYIDFTGYVQEKKANTEAGWNGILYEKVKTITETAFRLDLLWGLLQLEIKTNTANTIYDGTDGFFQWQEPTKYREYNWIYKVR